jgi:hypothetical protein
VLLSAQTQYLAEHDVVVIAPDGGVEQNSLAQTDIVITIDKRDITETFGGRYRGTVMADTLIQIRALLRARLNF